MITRVFPTPAALAREAAEEFLQAARAAARAGQRFHIGLSGGSTPAAIYRAIAARGAAAAEALATTHFFFGDERAVPNDHIDSNVRLARGLLLDPLGIPAERIHAPDGGAADLGAEARSYGHQLTGRLPTGPNGMPRFDLLWLGMGTDGHTASLFPGTAALEETVAPFVVNEVPQLNTKRLTITFPVIAAAARVVVFCTGESKAAIVAEIARRGTAAPVYPIERLPREAVWMLDADAARALSS